MSIQTNTNVSPYFDDFDSLKNFYRVMFKPGYPIQARELTQLQTILGDQIEKVSSTLFKTGDIIIPGQCSINVNASYVRAASITQGIKAKDFVGYTLTGVTSGVKALSIFGSYGAFFVKQSRTPCAIITFFLLENGGVYYMEKWV